MERKKACENEKSKSLRFLCKNLKLCAKSTKFCAVARQWDGDLLKLDGVGPVDNRPSTDKLHLMVKKKQTKKKHVTCDT